jgi:hypothetical protein
LSSTGTFELVRSRDDLPERAASLLDFWHHFNAQGHRPTRDDFTPFSLKKWLGHLDVYGVEKDGEEFRIRLNGTRVTELTGEDWTGKTARDVDRKFDTNLHGEVLEVVRSRQPAIHETKIFQKDFTSAHRLMLPIFSQEGDGAVTQVLLAIFWGD